MCGSSQPVVEEEVDVFAELLGDPGYGSDVGDLVDVRRSGRERRDVLSLRFPVPGQQFIEPMRGMGGNAREDVGEPCLRIDAVHLGCDDEAVHVCGALASAVGSAEQPGFPTQRHHLFILPMSGRSWKSITGGTRISAVRLLCVGWSSERVGNSLKCWGPPA
jgi:hypothetical protein